MTAPIVDLGEEADRFTEMRAELLSYGYRPVDHPRLHPGQRVRHRGEQYPGAYDNGTGVVLLVVEKPNSSWSQTWGGPDIELIVLKDRPLLPGMSRLSQLANYHVVEVAS